MIDVGVDDDWGRGESNSKQAGSQQNLLTTYLLGTTIFNVNV